MKIIKRNALFLMLAGLILSVKPFYDWLSFGGYPVIQLLIGIVCIIFGISLLIKRNK